MYEVDEEPFAEGSPAGILHARVTTALVDRLAAKCELPVSKDAFRKQLFFSLVHYGFGEMKERYPPKKIFRRQLEAVQRTAGDFVSALGNLNEASLVDVQDWIEEDEFLEWMAHNPEAEEDPETNILKIDSLKLHILEIRKWSQIELNKLNQEISDADKFLGPKLDQLIMRLAAVFERYNDRSAKSSCYYSAASDGYNGVFYEFVLEFLDDCTTDSYFSHGALWKRIVRVLSKDIQVKPMT